MFASVPSFQKKPHNCTGTETGHKRARERDGEYHRFKGWKKLQKSRKVVAKKIKLLLSPLMSGAQHSAVSDEVVAMAKVTGWGLAMRKEGFSFSRRLTWCCLCRVSVLAVAGEKVVLGMRSCALDFCGGLKGNLRPGFQQSL